MRYRTPPYTHVSATYRPSGPSLQTVYTTGQFSLAIWLKVRLLFNTAAIMIKIKIDIDNRIDKQVIFYQTNSFDNQHRQLNMKIAN